MARRTAGPNNHDESELCQSVQSLSAEVRVLRLALDELREELEWSNRNRGDDRQVLSDPIRLTSLSLDPAAADFGERLNSVSPQIIERLRAELTASSAVSGPTSQQQLW